VTIIRRGEAGVRVVDTETTPTPPPPAAKKASDTIDEVIVGEQIPPDPAEGAALAELIKKREAASRAAKSKRAKTGEVAEVSKDLDYLFGVGADEDGVEKLERKFWALMRVMARKGLISNE